MGRVRRAPFAAPFKALTDLTVAHRETHVHFVSTTPRVAVLTSRFVVGSNSERGPHAGYG